MTATTAKKTILYVLVTASVLAATALAGCTQDPDAEADTTGDQVAQEGSPVARLEADSTSIAPGDTVRLDASASSDTNGEVESYEVDFGDGTTETFSASEASNIRHTYTMGGAYTVTLEVTDDGADQDGELTDVTTLIVIVGDDLAFAHTVANVAWDDSLSSTASDEFDIGSGVASFRVDATVTSTMEFHNSQIRVSVNAPSTGFVWHENVTVGPGDSMEVTIEGGLVDGGTYIVESEALSGSATIVGQIDFGNGPLDSA